MLSNRLGVSGSHVGVEFSIVVQKGTENERDSKVNEAVKTLGEFTETLDVVVEGTDVGQVHKLSRKREHSVDVTNVPSSIGTETISLEFLSSVIRGRVTNVYCQSADSSGNTIELFNTGSSSVFNLRLHTLKHVIGELDAISLGTETSS